MQKTLGGKIWSLVQLGCTFYAGHLALNALQKKIRQMAAEQREKLKADEKVDTASEDSFPASDPPAYGGSQSVGPVH